MNTFLKFAKHNPTKKTILEWSIEDKKQRSNKIKFIYETNKHKIIHINPPQEPYRKLSL